MKMCILFYFFMFLILHGVGFSSQKVEKNDENWYLNAEFQNKLTKITGRPATIGNTVKLLPHNNEAIERRMELIKSADVILIKVYEFWPDKTGQMVVDALIERVKAGAVVIIQYDVKGMFTSSQDQKALQEGLLSPIPPHLLKLYDQAPSNVFLIPTSMPHTPNEKNLNKLGIHIPHDHEKYFICWNRKNPLPLVVIQGGRNIGEEYTFEGTDQLVTKYQVPGFKDFDLELMGPVTSQVLDRFIESAVFHISNPHKIIQDRKESGEKALKILKELKLEMNAIPHIVFPTDGTAHVRFIPQTAVKLGEKLPVLPIKWVVEEMLKIVPKDKTIRMTSGFALPTPGFMDTVIQALSRGIKIEYLLNSSQEMIDHDFWVTAKAAGHWYRQLVPFIKSKQLNLRLWEPNISDGLSYMHQKCAIFGLDPDDIFIVGSWNLNIYSINYTSEEITIVYDPLVKQEFDKLLKADFYKPWTKELNSETAYPNWWEYLREEWLYWLDFRVGVGMVAQWMIERPVG